MISLTKIIGIAFSLLMAYSTFLNYKKKEFSRVQFLFWEAVWISLLFVVFFTNLMTEAVKAIGFIRVMDFLTVAGFIVIILLSFHNYSSLNKIKKQMEDSTRKEALKSIKK
jgi:hypothetical protein